MKLLFAFLGLLLLFLEISCQSEDKAPPPEHITPEVSDNLSYIIISNENGGFDTFIDHNAKFRETIDIYSLDSLKITAHYYHANDTATSILLCHQARWNKYEYDSIAVVLQAKGYNCLAIDQRSGGLMGEKEERLNQTFLRAIELEKPTDFLDAEQDIIASIRYLYNKSKKPIILWGSSYSSTLALYNGLNNDSVSAVIAFSPGDYFKKEKGSLIPILKNTEKPFFIASSLEEAAETSKLLKNKILSSQQIQFIPKGKGYHGSRALWAKNPENEEYWEAINHFFKLI